VGWGLSRRTADDAGVIRTLSVAAAGGQEKTRVPSGSAVFRAVREVRRLEGAGLNGV